MRLMAGRMPAADTKRAGGTGLYYLGVRSRGLVGGGRCGIEVRQGWRRWCACTVRSTGRLLSANVVGRHAYAYFFRSVRPQMHSSWCSPHAGAGHADPHGKRTRAARMCINASTHS